MRDELSASRRDAARALIREHAPAPSAAPARHSRLSAQTDAAEAEATRAANAVATGRAAPKVRAVADERRVHRQVADPASASPAGLVVDDDTATVAPGQARKGEFLGALEVSLNRTVEAGFAGSPYDGRGCPMIVEAMDHYRRMPAVAVEASIRRWAPEAAGARRAMDYVPLLTERVRPAVDTFVRTGSITGLPPELRPLAARMTPGRGGVAGMLSGMLGGLLGGLGGLGSLAGLGGMGSAAALFAHRSDPVGPDVDAGTVRRRLGPGGRLDGGVRGRMERAFGHDFSAVRVHTDERSGGVARELGARALTVGDAIAFAPGEYLPGTPEGDAIIAHELAHTVQQRGAAAASRGAAPELEHDADVAAAAAVGAAYGAVPAGAARPRAASGLRLQRCSGTQPAKTATPGAATATPTPATPTATPTRVEIDPAQWRAQVRAANAKGLTDAARAAAMTALVQQALSGFGVTVRAAGESNTKQEDPADYVPTDEGVNFDVRLNSKTKYGTGRSLETNAGHAFTAKGKKYLVLGPLSLDKDGPARTQSTYEHELFHVNRHLGKSGSDADDEVEAYADEFPRYFERLGEIARVPPGTHVEYAGEAWTEMIVRFESASTGVQAAALKRIEGYYKGLSKDGKHLFDEWLRKRHRRTPGRAMVTQLAANLKIDLTVAPQPWKG